VVGVFAIGFWIVLFGAVPAMVRSLFRYRLWLLRDSLADDLLFDRLGDSEAAKIMLRMIESNLSTSDEVTFVRVAMLSRAATAVSDEPSIAKAIAKLDAREKNIMNGYRFRYSFLMSLQLTLGSPIGWVILVMLFPFIVLLSVYNACQRSSEQVANALVTLVRRLVDLDNVPPSNFGNGMLAT
jgi:hypothetical protein